MDGGDPLFGQQGPVLGGGPDAVGGNGSDIEDTVLSQDGGGGLPAVAGLAFLVLLPGLGEVDVHPQAVVGGEPGHPVPQAAAGGVLGVEGGIDADAPVIPAVPLFGDLPLDLAVVVLLRVEVLLELDAAAADVGADAGGLDLPEDGVGVHIHIGDAGDAGGDHLGQSQGRAGPDGPLVPLGLHREDIVLEPVLEVVAVPVAPHGGHGDMGVGVHQTGQEDAPLAVEVLSGEALGALGAEVGDLVAIHHHIGVGEDGVPLVHEDGGDIIDHSRHSGILPF